MPVGQPKYRELHDFLRVSNKATRLLDSFHSALGHGHCLDSRQPAAPGMASERAQRAPPVLPAQPGLRSPFPLPAQACGAEEWAPLGAALSRLSPEVRAGAEGEAEAIVGALDMTHWIAEFFPPQEELISP